MKKIILIFATLLLVSATKTYAITFVDMLPGGKNYLDPENLVVSSSSVETIEPFRIKGDTDYTLQFPGDMQIGLSEVYLYGEESSYIMGSVLDIEDCFTGPQYVTCFFHTDPLETHISLYIEARDIDLYHTYNEFLDFQLEEGLTPTAYEPYIMPYEDTTDPEFSGSATFVKSYDETIALQDIIDTYVLVIDEIDGDLSDSIVVTSDPYTASMHVVGTYTVGLSVTDQASNTATLDFTIIVNDTQEPVFTGPEIVTVSVDDELPLSTIISSNFAANDGYDGTTNISVSSDQYSALSDTVGSYPVTLMASDSSGNTASKEILIVVEDSQHPEIISSTSITVLMSTPETIADIIGELQITDNYTAVENLDIVVVSDEYTSFKEFIGTYEVVLEITDEQLNTLTESLYISVVDDIAPVINGPTTITTSYASPYEMSEIVEMLIVSDNYDTLYIEDLTITEDAYTTRTEIVGSFVIVFEVTDASSNTTTHSISVQVIDDQNPVFYIDSHLITVSPQAMFQPIDALNMLVKNGVVPEGEYTIDIINDEYSGFEHIPGTYDYKLLFKNKDGSLYEHEFEITVSEEESVNESNDWVQLVRLVGIYGTIGVIAILVIVRIKK